ncbi:MAG: hypothetical protein KAF91_13805 [Nostoc sp. TH1S01]|nr:hypothetical protein [Nostoc sp. TH1S01]
MSVNTLKRCLVATTVGLTMSWLTIGEAFAYTYTKIADTSNPNFTSFGRYPIINNAGNVVFAANLAPDGGATSIVIGNGGQTTTIAAANTSNVFSLFGNVPVLNDLGTVAFRANLDSIGSSIFTINKGTVNTIASSSTATGAFDEPKINNDNVILFAGSSNTGRAVFRSSGGKTTTIADTQGEISNFYGYTINDVGTAAFVTRLDVGGYALYLNTNGVSNRLIYTKDPYSPFSFLYTPAMNNLGTLVFKALRKIGGQGVFTTDGQSTVTIADNVSSFNFFENPAINDAGKVVFKGVLKNGTLGIYTGADPVADKVVAAGDKLFGSTVTDLYVSSKSLNNNSQVVFYAKLADGTTGIYRADPDTGVVEAQP